MNKDLANNSAREIKTGLLTKLNKPLAIILLFYLLFSFFMITKFPKVWIDASLYAVAPYTLVTEGKLANPVLKNSTMAEHVLLPDISQRVLLAGVYKIFGFGLTQSRALSILAGFLLIIVTYLFAKKYYDQKVATLAAILLVFDNVFFVSARTIRPDIFVALFTATAYFAFLHGLHTKSLKYFALSGTCIGVGLYTHPNSLLILIAILLVFLYEYKSSIVLSKAFWVFALFTLVGFAPYAIYVIKEDLGNNFLHFWGQLGGTGGKGDYGSRNYSHVFLGEYLRYTHYVYFPKRILIALIQILALIYAFLSKKKIDKYLAFMAFAFLFLLPFWNPTHRTSRYFIVLIPVVSILVSEAFVQVSRGVSLPKFRSFHLTKKLKYALAGIIFILYFLNHAGGDIYILWKHRDHDFRSFTTEIRSTIPQGSKTWGSMTFWMGLHDYPYITEVSRFEEVEKFKPQYAILYDSMNWGGMSTIVGRTSERNIGNAKWGFEGRPGKIEQLCKEKGQFIREIKNEFYGDIHIYKINWND